MDPNHKTPVRHKSKILQSTKSGPSKPVVQKLALEELLRQRYRHVSLEAKFPWLFVPARDADRVVLARIWENLHEYRGYNTFSNSGIQLACDFYLPDRRLIIEYDERQHFTKPRAISLALYPSDLAIGFDRDEWIRSCERIDAHDPDPVYRDEQRAYYDAVRDILATENGLRLVRLRHGQQDWTSPDAGEMLKQVISQARFFKIGLLAFAVDTRHPEKVLGNEKVVLEILNSHPDLDLLVGAGYTIFSRSELEFILKGNRNNQTVALLETWKDSDGTFTHKGYAVQGKELLIKRTPQVFKTSEQISKNPDLMKEFFNELEAHRRLRIGNKSVTWLICGEINVLRNVQKDGNRVEFRIPHDRVLSDRFQRIFEETDIFVDPTHTVMGNQGKLSKRRAYLSAGGRTFCSTSNVDITDKDPVDIKRKLGGRSVQYLWKNSRALDHDDIQHTDQLIFRTYSV